MIKKVSKMMVILSHPISVKWTGVIKINSMQSCIGYLYNRWSPWYSSTQSTVLESAKNSPKLFRYISVNA